MCLKIGQKDPCLFQKGLSLSRNWQIDVTLEEHRTSPIIHLTTKATLLSLPSSLDQMAHMCEYPSPLPTTVRSAYLGLDVETRSSNNTCTQEAESQQPLSFIVVSLDLPLHIALSIVDHAGRGAATIAYLACIPCPSFILQAVAGYVVSTIVLLYLVSCVEFLLSSSSLSPCGFAPTFMHQFGLPSFIRTSRNGKVSQHESVSIKAFMSVMNVSYLLSKHMNFARLFELTC